ncbi:MAG: hypothetical protein LDL33_11635 [Desulfomonile sp.]|nr:hypothetical protein [Desulfomonile sp.]
MKYVIAGYGHFGRLGLKRLQSAFPDASILVIDPKIFDREIMDYAGVTAIQADAVSVLVNSPELEEEDIILPMVPFHLAAAYVSERRISARTAELPAAVWDAGPNPVRINESTIAYSKADFLCPDDCPEDDLCTVTGQPRNEPLYALLERLVVSGFEVHVQRSWQLLPGIGGYRLGELRDLAQRVKPGASLIATACKCHGILTAVEAGETV